MFMKYFLTSICSIIITAIFFNLGYAQDFLNKKTETKISKNENNNNINSKYYINSHGIYNDSYFNYKNWKVSIAPALKHYQYGSTILINNKKNPISLLISDNDSGEIDIFNIVLKKYSNKESLCGSERIKVKLDENNNIKNIIIYDGDMNSARTHLVLLEKENNRWKITERKKEIC